MLNALTTLVNLLAAPLTVLFFFSLDFHLRSFPQVNTGLPDDSVVKTPPTNTGDVGLIPGSEDSLEKEMATHSSILAWKIP